MQNRPDVIIIGAGVIGLSIANRAAADGLRVLVLDRTGPASGASAGNAGGFAFAEIAPLASPKTLLSAPGWLFDPAGPLSVPSRYALRVAPWMLRFALASLPGKVRSSTSAQAGLMAHARRTLKPFLKATGTSAMLREKGQMRLYETVKETNAARRQCDLAEAFGFRFRHLDTADQIAEIQPGLSPRFGHATFTPDWSSIADPLLYTRALADAAQSRDVTIRVAEVRALSADADGVIVRLGDGATLTAARAVIAAGAHSHLIARTLGNRIPLETERGYNTTLPPESFDLRCHITFAAHGFVAAPLATGIRIGGAVELGGLDLPANMMRARVMLRKAATFMPGLKTAGGREWMGLRPSLPDTLPVIGQSRRAPSVIHAFGHGHLGLTQSTATADIVADLLSGRRPGLDIAPFSPDRF